MRRAHAGAFSSTTTVWPKAVERHAAEFDTSALPDALWQEIKLHYVGLLTNHKQPELAGTFFNSVSCKILHSGPTSTTTSCSCGRPYPPSTWSPIRPAYRSYYPLKDGLRSIRCSRSSSHCDLKRPFSNLERDLALCTARGASAIRLARCAWRRITRSRS